MKRRILILFVCLLLLWWNCFMAAASDVLQIQLGTVEAAPGESVEVPVSLGTNPGISGLQIKVAFGSELTLTEVEYTSGAVTDLTSQPSAKRTSPVKLTWYNGTANSTYTGVVAVLHFTVSSSCTADKLPLTLSVDANNVADCHEVNVPFTTADGAVKVKSGCSHETEVQNAAEATCTESGYSGDTVCKLCKTTIAAGHTIVPLGHDYGATVYDWSTDHSQCTATRVCSRNANHSESAKASVIDTVTGSASVGSPGERTFTATFSEDWAATQTATEEIPALSGAEISTEDAKGKPGESVSVLLKLANNPGIAGIKLRISYDSHLELTTVENQEIFPGTFVSSEKLTANPQVLIWSDAANSESNGILAVLSFRIAEDAPDGDYPITVQCVEATNQSLDDIPVSTTGSVVKVKKATPGDINDDGKVDIKDSVLLAQYLAEWELTGFNSDAADVNGDGQINIKDSVLLAQYLAEWDVVLK